MSKFMDVHTGMNGITADALREAHEADLRIQDDEGVTFEHAWADPDAGVVYCLSEAPSAEAVMRVHERAGHPVTEVHPVPLEVLSTSGGLPTGKRAHVRHPRLSEHYRRT